VQRRSAAVNAAVLKENPLESVNHQQKIPVVDHQLKIPEDKLLVVATRGGIDSSGEIQTCENDYMEYVAWKAWKKDIQGSGVVKAWKKNIQGSGVVKAWKKDTQGSGVVKGHVFQNITNCSIIIGPTSGVMDK
jgi:hypothetical protein